MNMQYPRNRFHFGPERDDGWDRWTGRAEARKPGAPAIIVAQPEDRQHMKKFLLKFCVLLLLLFVLAFLGPVQGRVIEPLTHALAVTCGTILRRFDPGVVAQGRFLLDRNTGAGIAIEAGCNGLEACLILVAAMLAYPAGWRQRLLGILCGLALVQGVNILRLVTLYYLAGWHVQAFRFAHLYLWPGLIMLAVLAVWLAWARWVNRRATAVA
jgi:exosortase H (IPTLxxWG-CTERM-specific)